MPNGPSAYAARVLEIIKKSLAAKEAKEYVDCRHRGGSMEECMGILTAVIPLPIPKPDISVKEATIALKSVREILLIHVEMLDKGIEKMKQ